MRRIIGGVLIALALVMEAGATGFGRETGALLELRLADPSALARIETSTETLREPRGGRPPESVTDLVVLMRPVAPREPTPPETMRGDGWRPPDERRPGSTAGNHIEAQLLVVTGGRISADGRATCDRFEWDMLVCQLPCDGGSFGLRRGARPAEHYLVLGMAQQGREPGPGGGFGGGTGNQGRLGLRLGACRTRDLAVTTLRPGGGRLSVEIPLIDVRASH